MLLNANSCYAYNENIVLVVFKVGKIVKGHYNYFTFYSKII